MNTQDWSPLSDWFSSKTENPQLLSNINQNLSPQSQARLQGGYGSLPVLYDPV